MSKITYNPSLNPQQAFVDVDAASIDLLYPRERLEETHKKLGEAYEHLSGVVRQPALSPSRAGACKLFCSSRPHWALARA